MYIVSQICFATLLALQSQNVVHRIFLQLTWEGISAYTSCVSLLEICSERVLNAQGAVYRTFYVQDRDVEITAHIKRVVRVHKQRGSTWTYMAYCVTRCFLRHILYCIIFSALCVTVLRPMYFTDFNLQTIRYTYTWAVYMSREVSFNYVLLKETFRG